MKRFAAAAVGTMLAVSVPASADVSPSTETMFRIPGITITVAVVKASIGKRPVVRLTLANASTRTIRVSADFSNRGGEILSRDGRLVSDLNPSGIGCLQQGYSGDLDAYVQQMRDAVTSIAPGKTLIIDSSRELCSYLLLAPGLYASVARIGVTFYSTSGFDRRISPSSTFPTHSGSTTTRTQRERGKAIVSNSIGKSIHNRSIEESKDPQELS